MKTKNIYEGNFGISPREIQQIIYNISAQDKTISFMEILDYLGKFIEKKNEYEFLSIPPHGNYHNPSYFIKTITEYSLKQFDLKIRASLGLVDDRSYEDYIAKYILHISALIKGEKIQSALTRKDEPSDMYFINEFESNINLQEDPSKFRTHMISKLGAFSLDNPGAKIIYTKVFPELTAKLKQSFHKEQAKKIKNIAKNLVYYLADESDAKKTLTHPMSKENQKEISSLLTNLKEQFHYSEKVLLSSLSMPSKSNINHKTQIIREFHEDCYIVSYPVRPEEAELRIDQFLGLHLPSFSREFIKKKIAKKEILLQNRASRCRPSTRVKYGERVEMHCYRSEVEDEFWRGKKIPFAPLRYLYNDSEPFGGLQAPFMATHPTGKHLFHCATVQIQKEHHGRAYGVHRLDRETSGLLLFPKKTNLATPSPMPLSRDKSKNAIS